MVKRLFTIAFVVAVFAQACLAQQLVSPPASDSSFVLLKTYSGDIADAALDHLDNLYIISSSGQIRKFAANGDSVAVYNQVRNFGSLFSLDVANPLRPLLFYKDFSTLVLLDRFLANRAIVDLRKHNILHPGAAGLSYDNNIWVFDEYENKLKKINEQGTLLSETADFRTVFPEPVRPQKILSTNGLVYLADSAHGVFVFDNYGSFKQKIPLKNWQSIAVKEQYLIQTLPGEIAAYNTATFLEARKRLPAFLQADHRSYSTASKLVIFSADSLRLYQYKF